MTRLILNVANYCTKFVISRLGLATINLQTKLEVSNHTRYGDMKSSAKCTNWG